MTSRSKVNTKSSTCTSESASADQVAKVLAPYDVLASKLMATYTQGKLISYHFSDKTNKSTTGDRVRSNMKSTLTDEAAIFDGLARQGRELDVSNTYCYVPYVGACGNIRIMAVTLAEKAASKETRFRQACIHNGLALLFRAAIEAEVPLVVSFRNIVDGELDGEVTLNSSLEESVLIGLDDENHANFELAQQFRSDFHDLCNTVADIVSGLNANKVNVNAFNSDEEYAQQHDDTLYNQGQEHLAKFVEIATNIFRANQTATLTAWTDKTIAFGKKAAATHALSLKNLLYAAKTVGAFNGLGFGGIPKEFYIDRAESATNHRMSLYTFCDTEDTDLVRTLSYAFDLKIDGVTAAAEAKTTGGKGGRRSAKGTPDQFQLELAAKFLLYNDMKTDGSEAERKKRDPCADRTWISLKTQQQCLNISKFNPEKNTGVTLATKTSTAHKLYPAKTLSDSQLEALMGDKPDVTVIIDIILACLYASNDQIEDTKAGGALEKIQNGLGSCLLALGKSEVESELIVNQMKTTRVEYNPASRFKGSA